MSGSPLTATQRLGDGLTPAQSSRGQPGGPQLRPYQQRADAAITHELEVRGLRSTLYVAATGSGKTVVIAERVRRAKSHGGRVLVVAHRDELLGQVERKLEDVGISADREQGKRRASTTARVVVASVQTLRGARLARWARDHFALVIVDECFPAGTLVDGRPIETLGVGDLVRSYNHATACVELRRVRRVFVSRPAALVTVHLDDGRAITCTAGHPFFTGDGYLAALQLEPGDQLYGEAAHDDMHRVQGTGGDHQERETRHGAAHRPHLLLNDLPRHMGGAQQLADHGPYQPSLRERAHDRAEPDATGRTTTQDAEESPRARPPATHARRQWDRAISDGAATSRSAAAGLDLESGSADEAATRQRLSVPLQARRGAPDQQDGGGGRRGEPRTADPTRAGREEAGLARVARVVRVEVHERRGADGFGGLCPGDLVYNIEVGSNHNYFVDGVLVHNCHHAMAAGYRAILDHFADAKVLGVTATPLRADGAALGEVFDSVAYRYEIRDAIREQYLVPILARRVELESVDLRNIATRAGDFAVDQLAAVMETERAILGVVVPLLELAGDRSAVVFGVDVAHAEALADRINAIRPGAARAVSGNTDEDERRDLLADFEAGAFQFLCNCAILTEGWDCARASCVAMARPTQSWALMVQCVGRGMRLLGATYAESVANGKRDLLLLNFSGRSKHRLVGPADCLAGTEHGMAALADDVAAEIDRLLGTQQLELERVIASADAEVGKRRAQIAKDAIVQFHAEEIDPFLGDADQQALHARTVVEPAWGGRPPSEAQLKALDRGGVVVKRLPSSFSMADASRLLGRMAARRARGLCSLAQAKRIAAGTGIDTRALTFDRAKELCTTLRLGGWRPAALFGTPEFIAAANARAHDLVPLSAPPSDQPDHEALP